MIVNLPTEHGLRNAALRSYFLAWDSVIDGIDAFDSNYESENVFDLKCNDIWRDERKAYVEFWQPELHAAQTTLQRANELELKSRICEVSPYLLLLKSDIRHKSTSINIDFSEMRTLDAFELPMAVNSLTAKPVSSAYIEKYNSLRASRNKYEHIGDTSVFLNPVDLLKLMVQIYLDLWPSRPWLKDKVAAATFSSSEFFSGKNWSHEQSILMSFENDKQFIPNEAFKKIFGVKKSALNFSCPNCMLDWAVTRWGPHANETKISFYKSDTKKMHCVMCEEDFPVKIESCSEPTCNSQFKADTETEWDEFCFKCGGQQQSC